MQKNLLSIIESTTFLVDSHCHLNFDHFNSRLDDVFRNMSMSHVKHAMCIGVDALSSQRAIFLAAEHECLSATAGIHPGYDKLVDNEFPVLFDLCSNDTVVGVGETGLDFFRDDCIAQSIQVERFRQHIEIAKQLNKPLVIHMRAATDLTLAILKENAAEKAGGVFHCFSESLEAVRRCLDIGFLISLSGILTFKNAEALREVARYVPLDRLLVETDSPYLAPVPYRGKPNEPSYVAYVAEAVAQMKQIDFQTICQTTSKNFFETFSGAARL